MDFGKMSNTNPCQLEQNHPNGKSYVVYRQRWYVLFSFSLLSLSSSWIWITWSPITIAMSHYWNVPIGQVDNLMGIYMYVYVSISFVSLYCVVNFLGLKYGLMVGGICNTVGAMIRYHYCHHYSAVYIGTLICALAQTFTLSTPPLLASHWFPSHERATATGIGILANQFGTAIGLGMTTIIDFTSHNDWRDNPSIHINHQHPVTLTPIINETKVKYYLGIQVAISALSLLLITIFGADQPPTPPSHAAAMLLSDDISNYYDDSATQLDSMAAQHQQIVNSDNRAQNESNSSLVSEITPLFPSKSTTIHEQIVRINTENEMTASALLTDTRRIDASRKLSTSPTYMESLRLLISSRDQLSFVIGFGTSIGVYYTIPTILSQITPTDWSSKVNGWIGLLYQLTGVFASYYAGKLLDSKTFCSSRNNRHYIMTILCLGGSFVSLVVLLVGGSYTKHSSTVPNMVENDSMDQSASSNYSMGLQFSNLLIVGGILGSGMCLAAVNTVAIEYGTGLAFPANETAVTGVYETSAELFGFLWVTLCGIWIEASHVHYVFYLLVGAVICSMERFFQIRNAVIKRPSE
jgi:Major Facilitator Superfamily